MKPEQMNHFASTAEYRAEYRNAAGQPASRRGMFVAACVPAWLKGGAAIDGGGFEER